MRLTLLPRLACPRCLREARVTTFDLDAMRIVELGETSEPAHSCEPDAATQTVGPLRTERPRELSEGYLVCRACRTAYPVLAGTAILPVDVKAHLATHGNVYRRLSIPDPRLARFLLSNARGGEDFVPFDEVVARYGDLLPGDATRPARPMASRDARLDAALSSEGAVGPALEIGCGVGRGTFVLAARTGDAVGVDRSVARVRRARNVQTTDEFRLPIDAGSRTETAIDLTRLARGDVDFLVAEPEVLPFPDRAFATVIVRDGDGEGPFVSDAVVRAEALRVARNGAVVLAEGKGAREGEPATFVRLGDRRLGADRSADENRVRDDGRSAARS